MSRWVGIRWATREDGPIVPLLLECDGAGELQFGSNRTKGCWRSHVSPRVDPPPRELPGAGAERRLYAAVLLPAVALALADRDQGDVPRARRRRGTLRARGSLAE